MNLRLKLSFKLPTYTKKWLILDLLGILIGVAGGFGAVIFRFILEKIKYFFSDILLPLISIQIGSFNLGYMFLPIIGALIVGPLVMFLAPETKGHGVPEVMEAVALKGGDIRKRVAFLKVAVSSITIGSGGSAGREGPIAQIGATVGSYFGQIFKLEPQHKKLMVVCGLSAGIAGTFNAPLGGALFGMEILLRGIGLFNAMPVILASVVSVGVASIFFGTQPAFIVKAVTNWKPAEIPLYLALGIIFGLLSIFWVKSFYLIEDLFDRFKIYPHLKPAVGGALTGIIVVFFPLYGIAGVGYEGIELALIGEISLGLLIALGFLKILATGFSVGSGGSGGIFAPSLFIGAMFGTALGQIYKLAFPNLVGDPSTYALAGMGALFAGAAQAPINVIIMIPEMSNDYLLIPPIMISSVTSFFINWAFLKGTSIYTLKLERRGVDIRMGRPFVLDLIKNEEIMTKEIVTVQQDFPISILELFFEEHHHHGYPVFNEKRELVGIVTLGDMQRIPEEERKKKKIRDITTFDLVTAYPDDTVSKSLEKMNEHNIGRILIVDKEDPHKLRGIVTRTDIIEAYRVASRSPAIETI
ncbi:MAG: chloride channel protein [Candidatus Heimdallarchaeaceae archaeon]